MLRRRIVAFITGLLVLHLSVVGADLACAQHAQHAGDHGGVGPSVDGMHVMNAVTSGNASMDDRSTATGASDMPCKTPVSSDCCRAMTSCGVGYIAARGTATRVAAVAAVITPASERKPGRTLGAPEPPPPKA